MKDRRLRLLRVAVLLVATLMLAACRQDAGTDAIAAAPEVEAASAERFQQSLELSLIHI